MEYINGNQVFYAYGEHYWVDIAAINNFQESVTDLIEVGDILRYKLKGLKNEYITVVKEYHDARNNEKLLFINGYKLEQVEILEILTKEQYRDNCYKVGG